jgi:hypothetical protein
MMHELKIVEPPGYFGDGCNYINDHSPMGEDSALAKIELFIGYGGRFERIADHIRVAWKGHSTGESWGYTAYQWTPMSSTERSIPAESDCESNHFGFTFPMVNEFRNRLFGLFRALEWRVQPWLF